MNSCTPYHQRSLSADSFHKLMLSKSEIHGLTLREIRCPYCNFLVERVFSDVTGHKMVYCKKCKSEYPVNLGYFRRMRTRRASQSYHQQRQKR